MKAAELGHGRGWLLAFAALCLVACGDDTTLTKRDAGMLDASVQRDAGKDAGGFIRRVDASTNVSDAVPMCNRFDPTPCGAGQECRLVISRAAGSDPSASFLIYPGCVEGLSSRPLGAPCTPFDGQAHPYMAKGVTDEIYVDPCAPGLYCAADFNVRDHYTCQRSCEPPSSQSNGYACPVTQACEQVGSTLLQFVCHDSDHCDPSDPTSCAAGLGCFLRLNDTGTNVLSSCLPLSDASVPDGQPCQYLNDCNRGSSCWGPTRLRPEQWTDTICRRSCDVAISGGEASDAGVDDDGGIAGNGCHITESCIPVSESKLDVSGVVPAPGLCE
jgi:hypothetical protein